MSRDYDVFISYNSDDISQAEALNRLLKEHFGIKTWFDRDIMYPGIPVADAISIGLSQSLVCLMLVGKSGQGPWQKKEIEAAIQKQIEQPHFRIIPVLLPNATAKPDLPWYMKGTIWADLREDIIENLGRLIRGIHSTPSFPLYIRKIYVDKDDDIERLDVLPSGYTAEVTKIVELLIGESLYPRRDVCVRELVQNAIDACIRRKKGVWGTHTPDITLRINSKERWFEVDDKGEGMNPYLLRNSFAIIGNSISDEKNILERTARSNSDDRVQLIAKFGIGFVSSFIISKKIVISTTFEGQDQINFSISAFNERFSYTDGSECGRDPKDVGTTVRVYLSERYGNLDILETARKYLRHISYCQITYDGRHISLQENWNVQNALISRVKKKHFSYEIHLGVFMDHVFMDNEPFIASNFGILIGDNLDPILPHLTPRWIRGEIVLWPNTVDLNVTRDLIINNEKSKKIKKDIRSHLHEFIVEIVDEVIVDYAQGNGKLKDVMRNMGDLLLVYNHYARTKRSTEAAEEQLFSVEESNELVLDLLHFQYGLKNRDLSLRAILERLRDQNTFIVYSYSSSGKSYENIFIDGLKRKGFLALKNSYTNVSFQGKEKYRLLESFYLIELLAPVLKEQGFEVEEIKEIFPEQVEEVQAARDKLPVNFVRTLDEVRAGRQVHLVNLLDEDAVFSIEKKWYLNVAHPLIQKLFERIDMIDPTELRLYMKGLLRFDFW